jgi:Putative metallopeptidase
MKRFPPAAVALALSMACAAPAIAQTPPPPPDLFNPKVEFEYVRPRNADFAPLYERLKARKVLETLRQFLAPLKFKDGQKLTVKFDECGAPYQGYKRQGVVTACYEFVDQIDRLAPTAPVQLVQTAMRPPVKPDAARVGPVVQALIHEVAVATFDLLDIPVWGRRDDAADRVAALVMLRFSNYDLAWNTIVGTAWFLAGSALAPPDLADVRGATAQRYYTTLCIAYGGDRKTFGTFVAAERPYDPTPAAGDLPLVRARSCPEEFNTVRDGFNKAVGPHLDQALLRRVQEIRWIVFND